MSTRLYQVTVNSAEICAVKFFTCVGKLSSVFAALIIDLDGTVCVAARSDVQNM